MRYLLGILALVSLVALALTTQSSKPANASNGLALLEQVSKRYADAKSYHIEAVEERTTKNDYENCLQKTRLVAAESLGGRYYYEGYSHMGGSVKVSNGKNVWVYHTIEKQYTQKPLSEVSVNERRIIPFTEEAANQAKILRRSLAEIANRYKSALLLPDEFISVNGRAKQVSVIRVQTADLKRTVPEYTFDETLWIDKDNDTILKTKQNSHSFLISGAGHVPLDMQTETTYQVVELDRPVSESLFSFNPPADAKLIENFPDPTRDFGGPDLTGQVVPDLTLKAADGTTVALSSFRGKPVLLDVWATWCPPCIKALPVLSRLVDETKDRGLITISVDQDEDAKTATDFLARKGYTWRNFHDSDGSVAKALGSGAIPRTMLIDSQGKVVFDGMGDNEFELRASIAKLGPEYASIALKPQPAPCVAQK
jgi:thiol-disulfide isomerase/thioredoxin